MRKIHPLENAILAISPLRPYLERATTAGFWSGVLVHAAILSLWQDWTGKAGYIAAVEVGWTDARYTVPLAILSLVTAIALRVRARMSVPRSAVVFDPPENVRIEIRAKDVVDMRGEPLTFSVDR